MQHTILQKAGVAATRLCFHASRHFTQPSNMQSQGHFNMVYHLEGCWAGAFAVQTTHSEPSGMAAVMRSSHLPLMVGVFRRVPFSVTYPFSCNPPSMLMMLRLRCNWLVNQQSVAHPKYDNHTTHFENQSHMLPGCFYLCPDHARIS